MVVPGNEHSCAYRPFTPSVLGWHVKSISQIFWNCAAHLADVSKKVIHCETFVVADPKYFGTVRPFCQCQQNGHPKLDHLVDASKKVMFVTLLLQ
jgi:hypothetical protein